MAGTSPAKTRWGCGETKASRDPFTLHFPRADPKSRGLFFRFESKDRIGGAVAGFYPLSANNFRRSRRCAKSSALPGGPAPSAIFWRPCPQRARRPGIRLTPRRDGGRLARPLPGEPTSSTPRRSWPIRWKSWAGRLKSRASIRAYLSICVGPAMNSRSGRCSARYLGRNDELWRAGGEARRARRARGTEAIASNPIAVLVPCHRVIKKDGSISGYRWGVKRKRELLAREGRSVGVTGA